MNTVTHPRIATTAGRRPTWIDTLARLADSARQKALAWWRPADASGAESEVAAQANRVRSIALKYLQHDPHFAADLFAAADRHEETHGGAGQVRL